jgi:hypothetical protein
MYIHNDYIKFLVDVEITIKIISKYTNYNKNQKKKIYKNLIKITYFLFSDR